jgi:hypothetical protein
METALGLHEGVFLDSDSEERITPARLAVCRESAIKKSKAYRQLVDASLAIADQPDSQALIDAFPTSIGTRAAIAFRDDLVEFFARSGKRGREFVTGICRDTRLAAKVEQDERAPKPIRFLASIVNELPADLSAEEATSLGGNYC